MALIDCVLGAIVKKGVLEVQHHDGHIVRLGEPADGFPEVRVRFADDRGGRDILLDLRLGAAEAFMDERLTIECGDVMELVALLRKNNRWDHGRAISPPTLRRRVGGRAARRIASSIRLTTCSDRKAHARVDRSAGADSRALTQDKARSSCPS
jgi:cyclopropane-fatty-acyl-phospholipid synthase